MEKVVELSYKKIDFSVKVCVMGYPELKNEIFTKRMYV